MQSTQTAVPSSTRSITSSETKDRANIAGFHAVRRYSRTRGGDHRALMMLLATGYANTAGLAWPAHSTMAEGIGRSVRLVGDVVRELIEMGELENVGTSHLGTCVLLVVCMRDLANFRPKKVSQKPEPKPRRKTKCTPTVQVQQPAAANSADKEPENFSSPSISPDPCISEEPVKNHGEIKPANCEKAPSAKDPAVSPQVLKTGLKTGTADGRAPLTVEERELAEKWFWRVIPHEQWKLGLPMTRQQSAQLQSAMRNSLIPWPQPGSKLAVMMQRAR